MSQPRKRPGRVTPAIAKTPPPAAPPAPPGTLGLLKVLVQPVLVLTSPDGAVQEVQHPVIEVKGIDWPAWAAAAFNAEQLETIRQGVTEQPITKP